MYDDGAEISLAYLDILCCALAGMLLIFFVFSLFNRQGESSVVKGVMATIPSEISPSRNVSEDEDVRLFIVNVGNCVVGAVAKNGLVVGRVSRVKISVLIKSTDTISVPLNCPDSVQQIVVTPVRSPSASPVKLAAQGQVTLFYDRSRWSI